MKKILILFISLLSFNTIAGHQYDPSTDTRSEQKALLMAGLDPAIFTFNGEQIRIGDDLKYNASTYYIKSDRVKALITDAKENNKVIDVIEVCKIIDQYLTCNNESPRIITFESRKPTDDEMENLVSRKKDETFQLKKLVEQLSTENKALKKRNKELEQ